MPHTRGRPRLHYRVSGREDGEPLLLITGFTISSRVFEPILERYGERFRCIIYDNRGSGSSSRPWKPTSMPELAGDAVGLLDELGIDSAHVYGLSMGGMIAQEMAIRFPHRVRGVVIGCSSAGGPRAWRPTLRELGAASAAAAGALREPGHPWLGAIIFSPEFRRDHPEQVRELLRLFDWYRAGPLGLAAHWWASVYHDSVSRLHRIQAPTLVMHGGSDHMDPVANSELLAARIPDAELAVVPGAGHAYPLEAPERSYELLCDWLDRRSPIAPGQPPGGWTARIEPVTRAFGLPIGTFRTGRSLVALAGDVVTGRR